MSFVVRWIVTAISVGVAVWFVPGIMVTGGEAWMSIALFGLVLALINISIKPILHFLGTPISCLTLGISYLIINTLLLYLAAWIANGVLGAEIYISGFGSAFVASIVVSVVSAVVNFFVGD